MASNKRFAAALNEELEHRFQAQHAMFYQQGFNIMTCTSSGAVTYFPVNQRGTGPQQFPPDRHVLRFKTRFRGWFTASLTSTVNYGTLDIVLDRDATFPLPTVQDIYGSVGSQADTFCDQSANPARFQELHHETFWAVGNTDPIDSDHQPYHVRQNFDFVIDWTSLHRSDRTVEFKKSDDTQVIPITNNLLMIARGDTSTTILGAPQIWVTYLHEYELV
jgi:hypothetical protein